MTPGDVAVVRLARWLAEAPLELAALARHHGDLATYAAALSADPSNGPLCAAVAVALHAYYTALESLFDRTARHVDGAPPDTRDWHRELLMQMAADLMPLRPRLVPAALLESIDALRRFRHFFRHAYAVRLEAQHLLQHAATVTACHVELRAALDAGVAHVQALRDGAVG